MSSNHPITPSLLKEEIEKLKVGLQEQKQITYSSNESLNRKFNEYIERHNAKIHQLTGLIDILIKENSELKHLLVNQKFVVQPINQYQVVNNQLVQIPSQSNTNPANQINLPYDTLLSSGPTQIPSSSNNEQRQQQQQSGQPSQQQGHAQQQSQQQVQQQVQLQQQTQNVHHHNHHHGQNPHGQAQQNGNLDNSLAESSTGNGILRFINNQYVDDEQSLNNQHATNLNAPGSRFDFILTDPSIPRSRHYRTNSNTGYTNEGGNVVDDDDEEDDEEEDDGSQIDHLSPAQATGNTNSSSRLQKSSTRQGEFDAENYDLIIHNDFNKVEDIYYEYQNSLKPQVERVQKAYKIKKIRKYQKIKALAVRIDRYKEYKRCSLNEAFLFFDNLRIAEDNTKRSIAWLYNTLPDVLKKHNLEDQLKRNNNGP